MEGPADHPTCVFADSTQVLVTAELRAARFGRLLGRGRCQLLEPAHSFPPRGVLSMVTSFLTARLEDGEPARAELHISAM